jgi:hypothetical protein
LAYRFKKIALLPYLQAIDEKPVLRHNFKIRVILVKSHIYFKPTATSGVADPMVVTPPF